MVGLEYKEKGEFVIVLRQILWHFASSVLDAEEAFIFWLGELEFDIGIEKCFCWLCCFLDLRDFLLILLSLVLGFLFCDIQTRRQHNQSDKIEIQKRR